MREVLRDFETITQTASALFLQQHLQHTNTTQSEPSFRLIEWSIRVRVLMEDSDSLSLTLEYIHR